MPPTTSRRPEVSVPRHRLGLFGAAAWSHRWGALSWMAGGAAFLTYFGFGYRATMSTTRGGAAAFGAAAAAVAEAMRPLSGGAERLDTYGGYTTYHNASIAALMLSLWAALQGARAVRGWEERGGLELWLASGHRRWRVAGDQWLGFLAALAAITACLAAGFGAGTVVAGEPNWGGGIVVSLETALVAATFFGVGMLVSQLTRTSRTGAGLTIMAMVGLYLVANMVPDLGWFAWLRFLSPFFYFHQSQALVPGHGFDPIATAVLLLAAAAAVAAAALAFERRDLWSGALRQPAQTVQARPGRLRLGTVWQRDAWIADVRAQWLSILLWGLSGAAVMIMIVSVAGNFSHLWEQSDLFRRLFMKTPGMTVADQYMGYVTILAAVAPVSFVVAEAGRWVGDLNERRTEALLAVCGSRTRAVLEWAASASAGVVLVSLAVTAGCIAGGMAAGVGLRVDGLVRMTADAILIGLATCGLGLVAVVALRNGAAVGALAALFGIGFLASLLAPLFNWPEWVVQLSPFDAFGTPYTSVPRPGGLALLAGMALVGGAAAILVARGRSALAR